MDKMREAFEKWASTMPTTVTEFDVWLASWQSAKAEDQQTIKQKESIINEQKRVAKQVDELYKNSANERKALREQLDEAQQTIKNKEYEYAQLVKYADALETEKAELQAMLKLKDDALRELIMWIKLPACSSMAKARQALAERVMREQREVDAPSDLCIADGRVTEYIVNLERKIKLAVEVLSMEHGGENHEPECPYCEVLLILRSQQPSEGKDKS